MRRGGAAAALAAWLVILAVAPAFAGWDRPLVVSAGSVPLDAVAARTPMPAGTALPGAPAREPDAAGIGLPRVPLHARHWLPAVGGMRAAAFRLGWVMGATTADRGVAWLRSALPPRRSPGDTEPLPDGLPVMSSGTPVADLIRDAGSAAYDPAAHLPAPAPVGITIPSLGVQGAAVVPVGLTGQGALMVPEPEVVGWYRYGPSPGSAGTSVLAGHVNFNRVPGVFRRLAEVQPGAEVHIVYDDGSERRFLVSEVQLFDKDALPGDRVWATAGDAQLALFTCGGRYDRSQRRYDQNIVVFARPA
jgi:hypothetical protein